MPSFSKERGRHALSLFIILAVLASLSYFAYALSGHSVDVYVEHSSFSPVKSSAGKYAASNFANGTAIAVISRGGLFQSVDIAANSMTITEDLDYNNAYFVFTKGTVETISNVMPDVLSGAFETYITPTFAFPSIKKNTVAVGLEYSEKGINLTGDYKLYPGTYSLIVKNEGVLNGKTVVSVRRKS